jgi:hypothetical protein
MVEYISIYFNTFPTTHRLVEKGEKQAKRNDSQRMVTRSATRKRGLKLIERLGLENKICFQGLFSPFLLFSFFSLATRNKSQQDFM